MGQRANHFDHEWLVDPSFTGAFIHDSDRVGATLEAVIDRITEKQLTYQTVFIKPGPKTTLIEHSSTIVLPEGTQVIGMHSAWNSPQIVFTATSGVAIQMGVNCELTRVRIANNAAPTADLSLVECDLSEASTCVIEDCDIQLWPVGSKAIEVAGTISNQVHVRGCRITATPGSAGASFAIHVSGAARCTVDDLEVVSLGGFGHAGSAALENLSSTAMVARHCRFSTAITGSLVWPESTLGGDGDFFVEQSHSPAAQVTTSGTVTDVDAVA